MNEDAARALADILAVPVWSARVLLTDLRDRGFRVVADRPESPRTGEVTADGRQV